MKIITLLIYLIVLVLLLLKNKKGYKEIDCSMIKTNIVGFFHEFWDGLQTYKHYVSKNIIPSVNYKVNRKINFRLIYFFYLLTSLYKFIEGLFKNLKLMVEVPMPLDIYKSVLFIV